MFSSKDILLEIFKNTSKHDLIRLAKVCAQFRDVILTNKDQLRIAVKDELTLLPEVERFINLEIENIKRGEYWTIWGDHGIGPKFARYFDTGFFPHFGGYEIPENEELSQLWFLLAKDYKPLKISFSAKKSRYFEFYCTSETYNKWEFRLTPLGKDFISKLESFTRRCLLGLHDQDEIRQLLSLEQNLIPLEDKLTVVNDFVMPDACKIS